MNQVESKAAPEMSPDMSPDMSLDVQPDAQAMPPIESAELAIDREAAQSQAPSDAPANAGASADVTAVPARATTPPTKTTRRNQAKAEPAESADQAQPSPAGQDTTLEVIAAYDETMAPGFAPLGLSEPALRAVVDLGFAQPTPIQEQTIPALLSGRDVIAQAPTGTGKTAAFGLPIVHRLDDDELRPQALIITPTRELAIQVAEALYTFGKYREMATVAIYGGQPYERQLRALKRGVQVVVGTPGRLQDLLDRGALQLDGIHTVILDEADEMLDMGFLEDIEALLSALPTERQTALFSATIPPRIAALAQRYLREPIRIGVAERSAAAPNVRQVYYEVLASAKPEALMRILDLEEPESVIVFVRTRMDADVLAELLSAHSYVAQAIHGEISQAQRERTLNRFREKRTQILVATDVAARGLDIPEVSHVVNYDMPFDAESYVHRIGRTGRAGRSGQAITLVTPRERRQMQNIEHAIHKRIERMRMPTEADVAARRRASFREDVLRILDQGELDPYLTLVDDLTGSRSPAELAAAAFKLASEAREAARFGRGGRSSVARSTTKVGEAQRGARELEPASGVPTRGKRTPRELTPAPMAWLLLRVGKRHGVRPTDIVGAIANEAGIPGESIGDIDIYDVFSFVEVPEKDVEYVRAALNATTIRGQRPDATLAQPGKQWEQLTREPHGGHGREARGSWEREERAPRERRSFGDFETGTAKGRRGAARTMRSAGFSPRSPGRGKR